MRAAFETTIHKFICGAQFCPKSLSLALRNSRPEYRPPFVSFCKCVGFAERRTSDTYNYNSSTINNIGDKRWDNPNARQYSQRNTKFMHICSPMLLCFHQQLFNEMQIKIIINSNSTIVSGGGEQNLPLYLLSNLLLAGKRRIVFTGKLYSI